MKVYNERHDVVIDGYWEYPNDAKDGQIVEHKAIVQKIMFYHQIDDGRYIRIELFKDMIKDLHNHINEVEQQTKFMECYTGPF